jgi:hemerythrin-like domain-containing protein
MCSYCGCRSIEPIGRFSAEHDDIINATGTLRRAAAAGDAATTAAAAAHLTAMLDRHTRAEEESLFAALRLDPEFTEHVDRLCAEHRDIAEHLDRLGAGNLQLAETFELSLRDHIDKEENGLFPAAVIALDAATLERLAARATP